MEPHSTTRPAPPTHSFGQRFIAGILAPVALLLFAFVLTTPGLTLSFVAGILTAGLGLKLRRQRSGERREPRTATWHEPLTDTGGQ